MRLDRLLVCLSLATIVASPAGEYHWLEAEQADQSSAGGQEGDPALSGGSWYWINNQPTAPERFLQYDSVSVADGGSYQVYVRKFWKHGPLRWRFDAQDWQVLTKAETSLLDSVSVGSNVANWVYLGEVTLAAGAHRFRVEITEASGAAAIDCFCITNQPFIARGKLQPNEKYGTAPDGWFPFEPDLDPFADSPIDLRQLNEATAGDGGFIVADGPAFVHADSGEPVRFWAANCGADIAALDDNSLAYLARQYAKYGINMVRYHSSIWDGSGDDAGTLDRRKLDNVLRFVAAMKREGIYTTLSIYFPLWMQPGADHPTVTGYTGDGSNPYRPFALLFFHQPFQDLYRSWWSELLQTVNPATGLSLADDPAVACVELVNEDSFLFWTFNPTNENSNIPAEHHQTLKERFHDWLVERYGSIDAAYTAWASAAMTGDDPAAGAMALRHLWNIQRDRNARDQDTVRFLTGLQMTFFDETSAYLRDDLGYQASISCSNWKTANDEILGPADKYSNTVGDHMDRHGYFGPSVTGDGTQSYSVRVGHAYYDRAAVRFAPPVPGEDRAFGLPLMDQSYNDKPSIISEIAWSCPNRYRADGPILMAAYGALQGTDGIYHFATSGPTWQQMLGKWSLQAPVTMGQFPAAALIYRQGLIATGATVADIRLGLDEEVYGLTGTPAPEPGNFDLLRLGDIPDDGGAIGGDAILDPLTYLVGRVGITIDADGGDSTVVDLTRHIDRDAGTVRSTTDELHWDYQTGLVRLDSPYVQGATGFLQAAGTISCRDLQLSSALPYGSIVAVSLDGRPLASSADILLQVMSEESNNGWTTTTTEDGRSEITDLGGPPLVVRRFDGTVSLTRADAASLTVTALDLNGYPMTQLAGGASIELQPDVLYYRIAGEVGLRRAIRIDELPPAEWSHQPDHGSSHSADGQTHFEDLDPTQDYQLVPLDPEHVEQ